MNIIFIPLFVKPDENARTYVLKSDRPEGPFLFAGRNSISSHSLDGFDQFLYCSGYRWGTFCG